MKTWSELQEIENSGKPTVRVRVVLDESGSMLDKRSEIIHGFNKCMDDLKKDASVRYLITLIKFSYSVNVTYTDKPLADVANFTEYDYSPEGGTALLDAVAAAINLSSFGQQNVMVVVFTDGQENSSTRYTLPNIQHLITQRRNLDKWAFVFMGANIEAWEGGSKLGIPISNTMNFMDSYSRGFSAVNNSIRTYSSNCVQAEKLGSWSSLDNDHLMKTDDEA